MYRDEIQMYPDIKTTWNVDEVVYLWYLWCECDVCNSDEPDDYEDCEEYVDFNDEWG